VPGTNLHPYGLGVIPLLSDFFSEIDLVRLCPRFSSCLETGKGLIPASPRLDVEPPIVE